MAPSTSPAADELLATARDLAPMLAEDALEAERDRRPSDRVISALRDSGLVSLLVPPSLGGAGADLDSMVEVGIALGRGDASMAWVANFYIMHNWLFCQFPPSFQQEVFADGPNVLAPAMIAPNGRAQPTDGGYLLSGRWQWGTGVMHADWVMAGGLIVDAAGHVDARFFAVPIDEVTVDDTWFTDGMRATGSNDVVLDDCIVPEGRTVSMNELSEGRGAGATGHPEPTFDTPLLGALALAAAAPAVGQARWAVERFEERMRERLRYLSRSSHADRASVQARLARAELMVDGLERRIRATAADVIERRSSAGLPERAHWAASLAYTVHEAKDVIRLLVDASGASAHFESEPLQRALRDVTTMCCHVVFDLDDRLEILGKLRLGLDTPGAMI
jgi:alkylation response protein AidB-like acyl-CoA dehydrogenase